MGTIAEKLNYLLETKNAIKQALVDNGVEVSEEITFRGYAELIAGGVGKKIKAISVDTDSDTYTLTFEDGSTLSGSGEFSEDGTPTSLSDDAGNEVVFSLGNPIGAKDAEGNVVDITVGGA